MFNAVQFTSHARSFQDAYTAAMRPLCQRLDLPQTAMDILLFLFNNPGMDTARDICTYRHLKPALVSFHVDRLVNEGYLLRRAVPGDRRKCRLVYTDKAVPAIRQGRAIQENFSRQLTRGLTEQQLEELSRSFAVIEENLRRLAADPSTEEGEPDYGTR